MMARVERQISAEKVCEEAVRQVRALTQFDRVMLYRFDAEGAGEVIVESTNSNAASFLGLRYPASDIPAAGAGSLPAQLPSHHCRCRRSTRPGVAGHIAGRCPPRPVDERLAKRFAYSSGISA